MPSFANIYRLGIKELWSLIRDPVMLLLIVHAFTLAIYVSATAMPETLNKAPIAIVDEDDSPLSKRIASAFFLPNFKPPVMISLADIDRGMDAGKYTFVLDIPPDFQRDVLDGKSPAVQLNVDATQMGQAFSGSNYVQQMVLGEVNAFVLRYRRSPVEPVELALRARFNPNLDQIWFGGLMEIINNVTMLSIILTGAALIRAGNGSPRESMPELVQNAMLLAPTTHFVMLAQAILFRGAGLVAVWPQFLALAIIGASFFLVAAVQFRKSVTQNV